MLVSQCSTATNGDQSGVTLLGEDRHESNLPDVRSSAVSPDRRTRRGARDSAVQCHPGPPVAGSLCRMADGSGAGLRVGSAGRTRPDPPTRPLGSRDLGMSHYSVAVHTNCCLTSSRSCRRATPPRPRASTKPAGVQLRAQPAHLPRPAHASSAEPAQPPGPGRTSLTSVVWQDEPQDDKSSGIMRSRQTRLPARIEGVGPRTGAMGLPEAQGTQGISLKPDCCPLP